MLTNEELDEIESEARARLGAPLAEPSAAHTPSITLELVAEVRRLRDKHRAVQVEAPGLHAFLDLHGRVVGISDRQGRTWTLSSAVRDLAARLEGLALEWEELARRLRGLPDDAPARQRAAMLAECASELRDVLLGR